MLLRYKVGAAVAVAAILLWGVVQYAGHRADEAAMQATIKTLEAQNKSLVDDREKLTALIETVRKDADDKIAQLEKSRPKTPEQAIRIVHDVLPQAQLQSLPDAPSALSAADAKAIADLKITVDQLRIDVNALRAENDGLKKQAAIDAERIKNLTTERDVAVKTAKGGSWLRRTARAAKYVGIGVGIGLTLSRL